MNKQAFFTILVLLACLALVQGLPITQLRCSCITSINSVNVNRIDMERAEYHEPNSLCNQEELIVTLRDNFKVCLNPNGDQGRRIIQALQNKNKTK